MKREGNGLLYTSYINSVNSLNKPSGGVTNPRQGSLWMALSRAISHSKTHIIPYLNASMDISPCRQHRSSGRRVVSCLTTISSHPTTSHQWIFQTCSQPTTTTQPRRCSMQMGPFPWSQPSPFSWINLFKESTGSVLICCACYAPLMHYLHFGENAKWDYYLPLDGHKARGAGSPAQERRLQSALW